MGREERDPSRLPLSPSSHKLILESLPSSFSLQGAKRRGGGLGDKVADCAQRRKHTHCPLHKKKKLHSSTSAFATKKCNRAKRSELNITTAAAAVVRSIREASSTAVACEWQKEEKRDITEGKGKRLFLDMSGRGGRGGRGRKPAAPTGEKGPRAHHAWLVGWAVGLCCGSRWCGREWEGSLLWVEGCVGTRDSRWALSFSPSLPLSDVCAKGSSISSRYRTVEEEEREDRKRAPIRPFSSQAQQLFFIHCTHALFELGDGTI